MRKVFKYTFTVTELVTLNLPRVHEILCVDYQQGMPLRQGCLWALANPDTGPMEVRFRVYGTGHEIDPEDILGHVASWQSGPFVWHMFNARDRSADR